MEESISRDRNTLRVSGRFNYTKHLQRLLALLHQSIDELKYLELTLDFHECSSAFPTAMVGLCVQILKYQALGVEFYIHLPKQEKLSKLFLNTNWAHYLEPRKYPPSDFESPSQLKAIRFNDPLEQHASATRIIKTILLATSGIGRKDISALEWMVNELTDNVLTHADSTIGGLAQVSTFANAAQVQFVVADAGEGIPKTLRRGHFGIARDGDALDLATREGVTRDPSIGQGNGLFGSYQLSLQTGGAFKLKSGYAELSFDQSRGHQVEEMKIPFEGTLVICTIGFKEAGILEKVLRYQEKGHCLTDSLEDRYENSSGSKLLFRLDEHTSSFGSRKAGVPIYSALLNLLEMAEPYQMLEVDLLNIPLVSSSFADEVFGKLLLAVGSETFLKRFRIINSNSNVSMLVERALAQRNHQLKEN